jgi:zinc/manganese transport system substrate-binding protein
MSVAADQDTAEVSGLEGPVVVVTTTILGSVVGDILTCAVGSEESMTVVMPIGADPHDFQPSSEQVALMTRADLVVANGLFLEEGLVSILETLQSDGVNVVAVAELVDPLPFQEGGDDGHGAEDGHSDEEGESHGDFDPHFWLDMDRMALASEAIGANLARTTGSSEFAECGKSVAAEIRDAQAEVIALVESIPLEARVLVTDHDAFGYFATRYGFRVVGVVVPGGSTLADPSSRELAELVAIVRDENVPVIFANTSISSTLVESLAEEVGRGVQVVALYEGSLGGPGSGAEDYISMMTLNASVIADALRD